MIRPESTTETNQKDLAYGFVIKRMGLKYIANVFMNMFQPKERNVQQEIISDGRIIYQSEGNSETV